MDVVASQVPFREDLFFSAGQELAYDVRIDTNGPQRIGNNYCCRHVHTCKRFLLNLCSYMRVVHKDLDLLNTTDSEAGV